MVRRIACWEKWGKLLFRQAGREVLGRVKSRSDTIFICDETVAAALSFDLGGWDSHAEINAPLPSVRAGNYFDLPCAATAAAAAAMAS